MILSGIQMGRRSCLGGGFGFPSGLGFIPRQVGGFNIRSPIGKPPGNENPYRAFRSPGMGFVYSIPKFWERKGTEMGTKITREYK